MSELRRVVRVAAADADEVISYRMPALRWNGTYALIARIVRHRVKQNRARATVKRTRRTQ